MNNLSEQQELFCIYYLECFNATAAYLKAYNCTRNSARKLSYELMKNPDIQQEIKFRKKQMLTETFMEAKIVFLQWLKIAFSDISEFIEIDEFNNVKFKDLSKVDTYVISEIETGKSTKIKLVDKVKALEFLSKYFDIIPDWKRKIEEERLKLLREDVNDDVPILVDDVQEEYNKLKGIDNEKNRPK